MLIKGAEMLESVVFLLVDARRPAMSDVEAIHRQVHRLRLVDHFSAPAFAPVFFRRVIAQQHRFDTGI